MTKARPADKVGIMDSPKYQFGNVVVTEGGQLGVICKTWMCSQSRPHHYDVYIRSLDALREYDEDTLRHYVFSKELADDELDHYDNQH